MVGPERVITSASGRVMHKTGAAERVVLAGLGGVGVREPALWNILLP